MIKILTAVVLMLLIAGCGSSQNMPMSHKPFQMVDKKMQFLYRVERVESLVQYVG